MPGEAAKTQNILFVCTGLDLYGSEVSLLEVVKQLGPPWRSHFVIPGPGRFADELAKYDFPTYRMKVQIAPRAPWMFRRMWAIFRLARLIWAREIRVVHLNLHFDAAIVAAACMVADVPLVVHVRNMIERPVGNLFRGVSGIICISEAVRDSLVVDGKLGVGELAPSQLAERVWIIPDGRDLSRCTGGDRNAVRREFGLDAQASLIGMAARFTPMKGQDTFLQMASLVAKKMPEARFLLVGADEAASGGTGWTAQMRELQNRLGLDGKVIFAGYRHDMPNVLTAMDCFVHPSQRGAFVSVLIEAMANGVPIVASDVDGIPECVGREGAAILLPPGDADAWAEAVMRVATDRELAASMSAAGKARAESRYDVRQLALETAAVFQAVCGD
jgi:glycosyltransferase involved in cell wall biosynthesis